MGSAARHVITSERIVGSTARIFFYIIKEVLRIPLLCPPFPSVTSSPLEEFQGHLGTSKRTLEFEEHSSPDMGTQNGTIFILGRPVLVAVFLYVLVALVLSAPPTDALLAQWCVADPQAPDNILQGALDWACGPGGADCSAIQWNQPCFLPNTLTSHASYAFNSYWQKAKHSGASCHFNAAAFVTESNPSHDACQFVYVP